MLETYFREKYQTRFVMPLANWLVRSFRLSPMTITLWACAIGMLAAPSLLSGHAVLASLLLLLSGYLDTLDGTFARISDRTSNAGAMLDIMGDRIVEFAVILGLYGVDPAGRGWLALGMLGSVLLCVSSFLLAGIFSENGDAKSFHHSPGLIERAEAFVFFIAMMLVPQWFSYLACVFILLTCFTAAMCIWQFMQQEAYHRPAV